MVAQARPAAHGINYFRIGTLPLTPDFGLGGAAEMGSGSVEIAAYGVNRAPGGLQACIICILRKDGRERIVSKKTPRPVATAGEGGVFPVVAGAGGGVWVF